MKARRRANWFVGGFAGLAAVTVVAMGCTPPPPDTDPGTTSSSTTSSSTTSSSTTSSTTTSSTTTTIPPVTSRVYMTDNVMLSAVAPGTEEAAVSMRVRTRGCSDFDSCLNGQRRSSGYTWFSALGVNLGTSTTSSVYYGMHGGLAFGGSGRQARLYVDWSGYCPAANGGGPLRHGGTACSAPSSNPTQKPHTVLDLDEDHWYRLTVRKTACSTSEVWDISGPVTGWELVLTDEETGASQSAGTWCLPNAPYIAHTSLFNEIIESRGPCVTDFGSVEFRDPSYRTASGWHEYTHAWGHYNGNNTELDADCSDTNLRMVGPNHIIDERMVPRGSNGGLPAAGYLWGP